jgi:hypothetical protein
VHAAADAFPAWSLRLAVKSAAAMLELRTDKPVIKALSSPNVLLTASTLPADSSNKGWRNDLMALVLMCNLVRRIKFKL